ncbi:MULTISPECIES: bifunctional ADP-dependent NAD(P)H-hydrate dehydratase/NAD(P)H-hydrate epimerase [Actinomyces]|uniref:bifunctional ADP-dependent NAD(P)H-hydrate dehydratase/NAD(P)H-hydrate epimerase n=1 Tax=Actinomyces TaxID=1654 RepID=UPI0014242372|nr:MULTISPECIES: bifunctional ADP-dependent NAD(P)H-hydrate dehydratase/NAD(P)H-hydrate epimerase [Actinomyces]
MSRTLDALNAYAAADITAAEAPLTRGTDAYMHAAAQALAQAAAEELRTDRGAVVGSRVLLLVGGGHNGGDALLAGALLARRGCEVFALLATDHPHAAALAEAERAGVLLDPDAGGADLVLDGLTGIGARGPLRPRAAALIAPLVGVGAPGERSFRVLAVDLPSGTGADDGTVAGPVLAADRTVTFTCLRGAHVLAPSRDLCGRIDVVDLGLPVPGTAPIAVLPGPPTIEAGGGDAAGGCCGAAVGTAAGGTGEAGVGWAAGLTDTALAGRLHVPGDRDHKYTRGVVEVWAGSETYPGAAVLTCTAACRTGAGMVRLAAPRRVEDLVLAQRPETVPVPGRHQALVIGPGTDPDDEARATGLSRVLRTLMPMTPPRVARDGAPGGDAAGVSDSVRGAVSHGAPGGTSGIGLGDAPGLGPEDASEGAPLPAVIDAGALPLLPALLAEGRRLAPTAVLTPHAGEAASLLTALGRPTRRPEAEDPVTAPALARELAHRTGACVLLKGTPTIVATPSGDTATLDSGPGWLATAGSGDVLAGVLGTLLAAEQASAEWVGTEAGRGGRAGHAGVGSHAGGADAPSVDTGAGTHAVGASSPSVGAASQAGGAGVLAEPDVAVCAALAVRVHALAGAIASGAGLPNSAVRWPGPAIGGLDSAPTRPAPAVGRPITALDLAGAVPAAVEHLLSLVEESRP